MYNYSVTKTFMIIQVSKHKITDFLLLLFSNIVNLASYNSFMKGKPAQINHIYIIQNRFLFIFILLLPYMQCK